MVSNCRIFRIDVRSPRASAAAVMAEPCTPDPRPAAGAPHVDGLRLGVWVLRDVEGRGRGPRALVSWQCRGAREGGLRMTGTGGRARRASRSGGVVLPAPFLPRPARVRASTPPPSGARAAKARHGAAPPRRTRAGPAAFLRAGTGAQGARYLCRAALWGLPRPARRQR